MLCCTWFVTISLRKAFALDGDAYEVMTVRQWLSCCCFHAHEQPTMKQEALFFVQPQQPSDDLLQPQASSGGAAVLTLAASACSICPPAVRPAYDYPNHI